MVVFGVVVVVTLVVPVEATGLVVAAGEAMGNLGTPEPATTLGASPDPSLRVEAAQRVTMAPPTMRAGSQRRRGELRAGRSVLRGGQGVLMAQHPPPLG
jgi:hypothetical protein